MGTPAADGWAKSTGFPLSKSKSFHPVFIKLGEYVGGHTVKAFYFVGQKFRCLKTTDIFVGT